VVGVPLPDDLLVVVDGHASALEVALDGRPEGLGRLPPARRHEVQRLGRLDDLDLLGHDGRREAGHPLVVHARLGGHVADRLAGPEAVLDLLGRQAAGRPWVGGLGP
jgi:hypothetical protein